MQTRLSATFLETTDGQEADAILRKCVHCGFCTATCPTYQLLGDELDGPRTDLPDQGDAGGRTACPFHAAAPRPVSDLPRVRDHLSIRGSLWAAAGYRAASHRARRPEDDARQAGEARAPGNRSTTKAIRLSPGARPDAATPDACDAATQCAGRATCGRLARAATQPTHVGTYGMCAARHGSGHQRRGRPGVGSPGYIVDRGERRLLRRACAPSVRAGCGARANEAQHRCLVAVDREGRRGGSRDGKWLRRDGSRVRRATP